MTVTALSFAQQGSGPPLVLLHAFPFDRRFWDGVIPAFSRDFCVITPDLLGFGQTESPAAWSIEDQANAVSDLLGSHGLHRAAILGLSMGGYVALALAANHPEHVGALVLADTKAAPDAPAARAARDEGIDMVLGQGVGAFADGLVGKLLGPNASAEVRTRARSLMNQPQPSVVTALRAMRDRPDRRPNLPAITARSLVLGGAFDTVSPPAEGREIAAAMRNATFVEIAGVGHLSNLEEPAQFTKVVTEFLKR